MEMSVVDAHGKTHFTPHPPTPPPTPSFRFFFPFPAHCASFSSLTRGMVFSGSFLENLGHWISSPLFVSFQLSNLSCSSVRSFPQFNPFCQVAASPQLRSPRAWLVGDCIAMDARNALLQRTSPPVIALSKHPGSFCQFKDAGCAAPYTNIDLTPPYLIRQFMSLLVFFFNPLLMGANSVVRS